MNFLRAYFSKSQSPQGGAVLPTISYV